jgi:acetolactate synthase-1/2/3 large subunit
MNSDPATRTSGGHRLARWLSDRGISHFFDVPGESFLPVLDGLLDARDILVATTRHESSAAFAAEAYAKATGRPAVCMATRGPGASNLSIGVQTAFHDGTPLLALIGLVPRIATGSSAFQEFDPTQLYNSIAKRVFVVTDRAALCGVLDQALDIATAGRPGPVVVGLPSDVLEEDGDDDPPSPGGTPALTRMQWDRHWDPAELFELLSGARRPALLAATAPVRAEAANSLATFATRTGIPVYGAWRRFSAIDNAHPGYVGSIGLGARHSVIESLQDADVILVVGPGLDQITCDVGRLNRSGLTIVQISETVESAAVRHLGKARILGIELDPDEGARELCRFTEAHPEAARALHSRHAGSTAQLVASLRNEALVSAVPGRAQVSYLMQELNKWLPDDAVVTSDAGNFAQWLLRHVQFGGRRVFLGALNGAMGYGLPAAIGASLALPGAPVYCIAGDGGFLMTAGEMETAVRLGLNIAAVVVDNEVYGTIRAKQASTYPGRLLGTGLGPVDFAGLAKSLGWRAARADDDKEVPDALQELVRPASGCRLLHVRVDAEPLSAV